MSPQRSPAAWIAVIGPGQLAQEDARGALAFELGRALCGAGYGIICGGLGGVMQEACRGAHASPAWRFGVTVGLLPDQRAPNAWVDVPLHTSLGHLRNALVAQADAVVAIGGGAGTLSEIALAWTFDRPIVAYRVEGWSGQLADRRLDARLRPGMPDDDRVYGVDSAQDALVVLQRLIRVEP